MGKEITYVIGHKNPDTDSICSAIALAELKKAEGAENIEPARAGDINPQTAFILDYFNVAPPRYLSNVRPRARDIMTSGMVTMSESSPMLKVIQTIRDKNIRFIPVVDGQERPRGIISPIDIARRDIDQIEAEKSREIFTSVSNLAKTLSAKVITDYGGEEERNFSLYIAAMEVNSFLRVLGGKRPEECIVIVGDRGEIQSIAARKGVGVLIIAGGLSVSDDSTLQAAKANGVSLLISPFDSATTAHLVKMSTPAHKVCSSHFQKVSPDELVDDLRHRLASGGERGLLVIDGDGKMVGIITKSNLLRPSGTSLILVDHNELSQAVDGADNVKILEVVDHHRLGNFHTTQPIKFICEPVGSTSTLDAEMYRQRDVNIKKEIAGLLLGGLLSDTILLKSPTTTGRDREIIPWLEEKSGLDHNIFGRGLFAATSSLKNREAGDVVGSDYKTFEAKGKRFGIGQVETIGFEEFFDEKDNLSEELLRVKDEKGLKLSALLVTDIVLGTSLLLVVADKEALYKISYPKVEENVFELKDVLSRKKQVAPHLLGLFNEIY